MNLSREKNGKNSKIFVACFFLRSFIDSVDAIRESIFKFATLMYAMGKELHQISRSRAERGDEGQRENVNIPIAGRNFHLYEISSPPLRAYFL